MHARRLVDFQREQTPLRYWLLVHGDSKLSDDSYRLISLSLVVQADLRLLSCQNDWESTDNTQERKRW